MTTSDFKKVARLLKEVYAQLEAEALSDGVDIFGEEYAQVRDALRLEVLKRLGFTLDEYREAKELVAPAKKVDVATLIENVATKADEVSSRVDSLVIPNKEELLEEAKEIAEKVVKAPVIQNNIVERTTVEKPITVEKTILQTVNEEYDDSPIFAELGYLNDKLDKLVIPEGVDGEKMKEELRSEFMEQLQHNINALGMPDFRKLAMGLQDQIDTVKSGVTNFVEVSGNYSVRLSDNTVLVNDIGTITLPHANAGKLFNIKNLTNTDITVSSNLTIDDMATQIIPPYNNMQVQFTGAKYIIL